MQLRMSPGGRMRFSRRKRPELPPSSVTVTMAARSAMGRSAVARPSERRITCSLSPRSSVESPVPPPRATTRKPGERAFDLEARFVIRIFGIAEAASFHGKESNTARRSRNQKQMTHPSEGIATDDNIFARRTTNLRISSTEGAEFTETEKREENELHGGEGESKSGSGSGGGGGEDSGGSGGPAQRYGDAANSGDAARHGGGGSRRRRLRRRSDGQPAGKARGRDFWERGGAVCAHGLHGESHLHQSVDASRRRSDLRRAEPRRLVRVGVDVGHRRLHAASGAWRRRDSDVEANRGRDPAEDLLRFADRAGMSGKHEQHGGRNGLFDRAGGGYLRPRA